MYLPLPRGHTWQTRQTETICFKRKKGIMIKYIPKHTSKNPRGHIYNIPKLSTFTQKIIKITCIYKYVDRQEE